MSLGKNRGRILAKGIGNLWIAEKEPTLGPFQSAGYIKSTSIQDVHTTEDHVDETGSLVHVGDKDQIASVVSQLMQTSTDELSLIRNAGGKIHAVRYCGVSSNGLFQYFSFDNVKIDPSVNRNYQVGEQLLDLKFKALIDQSLAYAQPPYVQIDAAAEVRADGLQLWVEPSLILNNGTVYILDLSGFGRVGTLTGTGLWTVASSPEFLRLDGTDDAIDFGNVCNFGATDDFLIEAWVRVMGADGALQEIISKKSASGTSAGYSIVRNPSNKVLIEVGDGTNHPTLTSSTSVLQNIWTHVALVGNHAGNGQIYLNGAADGSAVGISSVGNMTTTTTLALGKLSTGFGQVDLGGFRVYNFGAAGLPSDITTIVSRHFMAQRTNYGV